MLRRFIHGWRDTPGKRSSGGQEDGESPDQHAAYDESLEQEMLKNERELQKALPPEQDRLLMLRAVMCAADSIEMSRAAHKRLKIILQEELVPAVCEALLLCVRTDIDDADYENRLVSIMMTSASLNVDQSLERPFATVVLLLSNLVLQCGSKDQGYDARVRHVLKMACVHVLYQAKLKDLNEDDSKMKNMDAFDESVGAIFTANTNAQRKTKETESTDTVVTTLDSSRIVQTIDEIDKEENNPALEIDHTKEQHQELRSTSQEETQNTPSKSKQAETGMIDSLSTSASTSGESETRDDDLDAFTSANSLNRQSPEQKYQNEGQDENDEPLVVVTQSSSNTNEKQTSPESLGIKQLKEQEEQERMNLRERQSRIRYIASRKFELIEKSVAFRIFRVLMEENKGMKLSDGERKAVNSGDDALPKDVKIRKRVLRGLQITTVGAVAGTLFAVTGGLAGPAIAAAIAGLGVASSTSAATAIALLTTAKAAAALFGVGGGGIAAYKMKRRTEGLTEFEIRRENIEQNMYPNASEATIKRGIEASYPQLSSTICISGWLQDKSDYQRPWGIQPTDPPIQNEIELLKRFYTVYDRDLVDTCEETIKQRRKKERKNFSWPTIWAEVTKKYGKSPEHLLPFDSSETDEVQLSSQESASIHDMLQKVVLSGRDSSSSDNVEDENQSASASAPSVVETSTMPVCLDATFDDNKKHEHHQEGVHDDSANKDNLLTSWKKDEVSSPPRSNKNKGLDEPKAISPSNILKSIRSKKDCHQDENMKMEKEDGDNEGILPASVHVPQHESIDNQKKTIENDKGESQTNDETTLKRIISPEEDSVEVLPNEEHLDPSTPQEDDKCDMSMDNISQLGEETNQQDESNSAKSFDWFGLGSKSKLPSVQQRQIALDKENDTAHNSQAEPNSLDESNHSKSTQKSFEWFGLVPKQQKMDPEDDSCDDESKSTKEELEENNNVVTSEAIVESSQASKQSKDKEQDSTLVVWDWQALYGGDLHTVTWESKVLMNLTHIVSEVAAETTFQGTKMALQLTIVGAFVAASALPSALFTASKLIDDPYQIVIMRADEAGKELAKCLLQSEERRPVTLVGFSFGARVIYSCLMELARHQQIWEGREAMNSGRHVAPEQKLSLFEDKRKDDEDSFEYAREPASIVEDVVFMGLPRIVDTKAMSTCREIAGGRVINCYTKNDWLLSLMFYCRAGAQTCGTYPIEDVPGIENYNVTEYVKAHARYGEAVPEILQLVNFGKPNSLRLETEDVEAVPSSFLL